MSVVLDRFFKKESYLIIILILLSLFLFFFKLGSYGLMEPDEGRYSEIPREMIETGNYIVPHLNYVKYFEKPVLQYWMTAFSFKVFGFNEFASRFVPAFFAFLGVLLLYFLGKRMFGKEVGFLSALLLITSFEYFALTKILVLDMTLNFFISLSLALFYFGFTSEKRSTCWYCSFYIAMALGSLVKGPISLVFPLGIVFWFLILTGNFKRFKELCIFRGLLLVLLVAAPWYVAVCLKDPHFFNFFFIHEHVMRFLTKVHGREGSVFYFVPVLLLGFFPWIVYFPVSVWQYVKVKQFKQNDSKIIFLLVWFFLIFAFFSVSSSKLPAYIILVYFPLCLLTAKLIYDYLIEKISSTTIHGATWVLFLLNIGFMIGVYMSVNKDSNLQAAHGDALKIIAYIIVSSIVTFIALLKKNRVLLMSSNLIMIFLILTQMVFTFPKVESFRSAKGLAKIINKERKADEKIVFYRCYLQSIPFYTNERGIIVCWEGELEFGFSLVDTTGFFYPDETAIAQFLNGEKRVFCIAREEQFLELQKRYMDKMYRLGDMCNYVLFSNKDSV